ncbi:hypothetical protein ACOMHN_042096 [Nucella lapillus]
MKNFLHGGSLGHSNLKIESLAEDLKDDHLLALVCAVALLYFAITGPFWQLLESNTKYFELHTYIQQLERSVERWRGDASELLDPGFPGVFGGEFCIVSDMKAAVYKFVSEHTNTVKHALKVLMRDLLVVMRLQLVDFLSGGKYGQAQPPEVMEKLKHCPITNLLDVANVDSQYVFRWDVEVLPVSNDDKIWQVSDLQDIADAYKRLLQ